MLTPFIVAYPGDDAVYLPPPIPLTTPMMMADATIIRSKDWIKTDPVSVPVMIEVIRLSMTT